MTSDITRRSRVDATKVSISLAVKALLTVLASVLVEGLGWNINPVALLGCAYVFELIALAVTPEDIWKRIGARLVPSSDEPKPPSLPPLGGGLIILVLCCFPVHGCGGTVVRDANKYRQELRLLSDWNTKLSAAQLEYAANVAALGDMAECERLAKLALIARHRTPYHVGMALAAAGLEEKPKEKPDVPLAPEWCKEAGAADE